MISKTSILMPGEEEILRRLRGVSTFRPLVGIFYPNMVDCLSGREVRYPDFLVESIMKAINRTARRIGDPMIIHLLYLSIPLFIQALLTDLADDEFIQECNRAYENIIAKSLDQLQLD